MKTVICKSCGSNDLYEENGYRICRYCGTKFLITADDKPAKESNITVNSDVARLLEKCKSDPGNAKKYAGLILDIDPHNAEARRILDTQNSNQGCYIATAVYGSYDCPEVWTLRRYRDDILSETWYGRAFIRMYYAVSPSLVKWFGNRKEFISFFLPKLNSLVSKLNQSGIKNTSYQDKKW